VTGITSARKKKEKKGGMFHEAVNIVEVIHNESTYEFHPHHTEGRTYRIGWSFL
jgi:hypothetical protein